MKTWDYTKLPLGTEVEGRKIEICPRCGKNGLPNTVDGKKRFDHFYKATSDAEISFQFEVSAAWCPID